VADLKEYSLEEENTIKIKGKNRL